MKVAIVLNTSWNIYNFRMSFIRSLLSKGYEVHCIAPKDEYSSRLEGAGCHFHPVKMDSRGANPIKDFALTIELWSIYRKIKPDVVLHYTVKPNVYGTIAASLLRIPIINNVCGLGTVFLKKDLVSHIAMLLYKISFRFPRKVFFQNEDDLKLFIERKLIPEKSVDILPGSGIDLNHFKPSENPKNQQFTFLMVSRLIYDKGVMEYVEAVRRLKEKGVNARFQVLGAPDPEHRRGIPLKMLHDWIASGTIEYLGTTEDVRQFINHADCIILPSYREGTPRTLLEASSSSKPIIATNVPGCTNVVEHNVNGLLCKMKDADDLASKMDEMLNMEEAQRMLFGKNGRQKMESNFDESLVINKYLSALEAIKVEKRIG